MAISAHTRLGSYEVISPLGSGGMGEVYRARDTNLRRDVAIKVLPDAFAKDPERLGRFEREARILASLNHPNIAAVYGLERSGDLTYLVMELVPGETLGERLTDGPLEVGLSIKIFHQIAQALEAAHENGVIHRDLKPENIKITPEKRVKVLDFGLAKAFAPASATAVSKTPTATFKGTSQGVIMGTPAYMSPEQVRGQQLDKRADIWSFGCCFYEALTGRHPFYRGTASDVLAAILNSEPDWNVVPKSTPRGVRALIKRCLQKDTDQRLHDIADARIDIGDAVSMISGIAPIGTGEITEWRKKLLWAVGVIVGTLVLGLAIRGLMLDRSSDRRPVRRFVMGLPTTVPLALGSGPSLALSPDGTRFVYAARRGGKSQLYLRNMDELEPTPIPGTEEGLGPFFSPEGDWLGFFAEGKLKTVPLSGGRAMTLGDGASPRGASWGSDGTIVFAPLTVSGLSTVSTTGAGLSVLTTLDSEKDEKSHRWPSFLPGGTAVLYTSWTSGRYDIEAVSLDTGERQTLIEDATYGRYSPTGHLVFARGSSLFAVPFDPSSLEVGEPAVEVIDGVMMDPQTGAGFFDFSDDGLTVYVPGGADPPPSGGTGALLSVDRQGVARPLAQMQRAFQLPRISPVDARRLIVTITEGNKTDVWGYEIGRGVTTRLTFEASNGAAIWTPDGTRITFSSDRLGSFNVFSKASDGSGSAERLLESAHPQFPSSWSPDGQHLALTEIQPSTGLDILLLKRGAAQAEGLMASSYNESGAMFSPDGRWIAYVSDESGQDEVYVRAHPSGGKFQISAGGGTEPVWARDGRELFYRSGDWIMAVGVQTEPQFMAGKPQALFEAPYDEAGAANSNFDTTADGGFVMVRSQQEWESAQLIVVTNWFEELVLRLPSTGN
jgi:serine/threonine-protein kinase